MATSEPIRDKDAVKRLVDFYLHRGQPRNHVLIVMGIYTALRISDLLGLTWADVYSFEHRCFHEHIYLREQKTDKKKAIALNQHVTRALSMYLGTLDAVKPADFIFRSRSNKTAPITRSQAFRIIRDAAEALHLPAHISCHSLRKTFGYHAWKSGQPLAVIMNIYNHSSFSVTQRYLGVSQDDQDTLYREMQLW